VVSSIQTSLSKLCMYFASLPCMLHSLPMYSFARPNNASRGVQIMKVLIVHYSISYVTSSLVSPNIFLKHR
jgi:hypothetical protein